ncbi:NADP-dependent oxidoreductase domain-containing protein [Leucosporidium creatinivorum]|uniref:NADP-dependent oxidoreductase domain-containing protein n=1 Tax=Leucosporidium creatinivorum TaxID=106004 RepID=A0A1Y2F600_9BASI|nr:NADP-dependent oxidoreductase domain-containing protein [Leucosporidium creatinivorum]
MSESFKLNTGAYIPSVGLGTWQSAKGEVTAAVAFALAHGYNHIDAAWCYGNEDEVGEGIRQSGRKREELFLTSKVWGTYHTKIEENLDETLRSLGTDYVDLYLVHWPIALNPNGNHPVIPKTESGARDLYLQQSIEETWKGMEALLKTGKVKAIGVCNCSPSYLERILKVATVVPAVNQIELHPYLPQHSVVKYCQDKGITVQAFSPLGSAGSPILQDPEIIAIAEKHNASVGQILISYQVARGVVVLPKSVTPKRIEENIRVVDLPKEDVEALGKIAASGKTQRFVKPDWGVDLGFEDW